MSQRQGQTTSGDHYDTLGVPRDATTDEIKKAYRKLARQCHPDVAGDTPEVKERFNRVREAYETLSDPVKRATYDRRGHTYFAGPGRFGGKWRPPGGHDFEQVGDRNRSPRPGRRQGRRDPANDLGLDDLFGDFGFGETGGKGASVDSGPAQEARRNRGSYGRPGSSGPVGGSGPGGAGFGGYQRSSVDVGGGGPSPQQGRDICMRVDVPGDVAARGGTVTLRYPRLRLTEDGRGNARYDEIHDLRIPPGVRTGQTLRVPRMGDAGLNAGPYGDLVCDLVVHADRSDDGGVQQRRGDRRQHRVDPDTTATGGSPTAAGAQGQDAAAVDITIVEALLGGRVRVETPAGPVHVSIPPCTDSGTRLRLRGRGRGGADHYVELRIVTPERLDQASRALIERFAELNPEDPD